MLAPRRASAGLDEALDELGTADPETAELVKLRFFAGLTIEQAADALGNLRRNR